MRRLIRHATLLIAMPWLTLGVAHAFAAPPAAADIVDEADRVKESEPAHFAQLLQDIQPLRNELRDGERARLTFLEGWQAASLGEGAKAKALLDRVVDVSSDRLLRFRALAALLPVLDHAHHYEEAFRRLNQWQELLPSVQDNAARQVGLMAAARLLDSAGQFDLAEAYAKDVADHPVAGASGCAGMQLLAQVRLDAGRLVGTDPDYAAAVSRCNLAGEPVAAESIRAGIGAYYLKAGKFQAAVDTLAPYRDALAALGQPVLLASVDTTLAGAYLGLGDLERAHHFADMAAATNASDPLAFPRHLAFKVLYEVEQRVGDARSALGYHEQYMAAEKAALDDISARSVAFQVVDQQALAHKADMDALNKQNEILRLSNALDRKEVENGRLYIFVLGLVLVGIVALVLRLRRSQMRFMRMARRDGLTGICNREHFVEQSERVLAYGARSDRGACLILFDLDHFKNVNDTWGHSVGDEVLKRAVDVCRRALHACDVFGRLGGEEFAVLLPDCSPAQARARAEQLRLSISATSATPSRPELVVTASFGVASTLQCGFELHRLLVVADGALYRAKRSGRNCVFMGDSGDIPDSPYPVAASG
jgi:diguanylate cyclase (GGDEF)-like protein